MGSSGKRVWNSKELQSTKRKELASWGKDVRGKYLKEVRSIRKWDKSIGRLGQRRWEEKESGGSRRQKQRSIVATIRKLWSRMKNYLGLIQGLIIKSDGVDRNNLQYFPLFKIFKIGRRCSNPQNSRLWVSSWSNLSPHRLTFPLNTMWKPGLVLDYKLMNKKPTEIFS